MIIRYIVEPISEVAFENITGMSEKMSIDGVDITFDLDDRRNLKRMNVSLSGLPMKWERKDLIDPQYPETKKSAFRTIKYLADRIQLQVKLKSIDLSRFHDIRTEVIPETTEEKENWKKCRKRLVKVLEMPYSILGAADTSDYESGYKNAQAFSNFVDALNSDNPIIKFERLYKVVEAFFTSNGNKLDTEVYDFMIKHDAEFTLKDFQQLRELRNRCIHPQHRKGHISSNELDLINDLTTHTKKLEQIAKLLLDEN